MSDQSWFRRNEIRISRISTIVLFLALIRCITEAGRLSYGCGFDVLFPFMLGSLITAVGLLAITILSFYGKHKLIIAIAVVVIALLFTTKFYYQLP